MKSSWKHIMLGQKDDCIFMNPNTAVFIKEKEQSQ